MGKKKIAILSAVNIKHMSLISLYTSILKKRGIDYDIIYMDKYGEDEEIDCLNKYRYVNIINQKLPIIIKKIKYMFFLPYAKKILKRNNYDFIIVWNDLAIFMFANFLSKCYKGKYSLNVRDNMYYEKDLFKNRYKKVFRNSAFNTISSKGYLDILPQDCEYIQINSLNLSVLDGMDIHRGLRNLNEPIRIGFIGYIRYYERNKKMLDVFKNDSRFELHYYGKNAHILEGYAKKNNIENAVFHDSFPVSDTGKYLSKVDMINNLYGNDTINVRKAISIKFFHALYARIPILVNTNTYIGEEAVNIGYGFYFDEIDEYNKDMLFNWYHGLDFQRMDQIAVRYLDEAIKENKNFEELVVNHICK